MKHLTIALALAAMPALTNAAPSSTPVAAAVADLAARSPDNVKLDESRKPAQLLTFLGLKPGMRVLDLYAAGRTLSYHHVASFLDGPVLAQLHVVEAHQEPDQHPRRIERQLQRAPGPDRIVAARGRTQIRRPCSSGAGSGRWRQPRSTGHHRRRGQTRDRRGQRRACFCRGRSLRCRGRCHHRRGRIP